MYQPTEAKTYGGDEGVFTSEIEDERGNLADDPRAQMSRSA